MDKLVDNRNSDLWNYITANHLVQIEFESGNEYRVFTKNEQSVIYVPFAKEDPASFTHELLHIFLYLKNVHIGAAIVLSIRNRPVLKGLVSEELLEHIGNSIEHIKMLPAFLKMGYPRSTFLSDYSKNKLTDIEIELLADHFEKGKVFGQPYSKEYIDFFIGKYFTAICCPNVEIDYTVNLRRLKEIEEDLFDVLDKFLTNWKGFDYDNTDPIVGGYRLMVYDFVDGLEKWVEGKFIV